MAGKSYQLLSNLMLFIVLVLSSFLAGVSLVFKVEQTVMVTGF